MKPENNFDLLRLTMAFAVLLAHAAQLSRAQALGWIPVGASTVAVQGFFAISGYLMIGSFERSRSVGDFFARRFLRIYPAYAASVVGVSALLVAATPAAGLSDWLRYLGANLGFANWLHPGIAGIFDGNRVAAINGALWSMKFEVCCYLAVPLVFTHARRAGWALVLPALYISAACAGLASSGLPHQVAALLASFVAGAAVRRWAPFADRYAAWLLAAGGIGMLLPLAQPAALAIVIIGAARTRQLVDIARFGDLSYGVYITHFPVIQVLVAAGLFTAAPWGALALSMAVPLVGAVALRHLVELPCARLARHFVGAGALLARRMFLSSLPLELPK